MLTRTKSLLCAALCTIFMFSCQNDSEKLGPPNEVSEDVYATLESAGFDVVNFPVFNTEIGYVVEQDILISHEQLENLKEGELIPSVEHYSTDNLVTGTPRTINVFVSTRFSSQYFAATDAALARYNAEGLNLVFNRVTSSSSADITIQPSPWYYGWFGILGSAGFPTASGDPHNQILLTRSYYDNVTDIGALTTTIAHEMGHCIGFRHTDYMDRSFSCGGSTNDEGDGGVGANYIPGTPSGPEAASWMLACSDGTDRPFTTSDQTALDYLY
ncbi:M57 family metalloprotease [Marinigracilibium pacificum]|uniref:Protease B n=1 Tax=Marinigracilibium pacificum TaxID=2729599 RepID=A0A848IWB6_9BACT|nr:M57 family metalloprotease [Marinigracilibium pacificum]NMM47458.1 protease B [Marinigracilibium pacificum]